MAFGEIFLAGHGGLSLAGKIALILVPRGRAPFGQHQESRPLARSNDILVLKYCLKHEQQCFIGFKNTRRSRVFLNPIKHVLRVF